MYKQKYFYYIFFGRKYFFLPAFRRTIFHVFPKIPTEQFDRFWEAGILSFSSGTKWQNSHNFVWDLEALVLEQVVKEIMALFENDVAGKFNFLGPTPSF